MRYAAVQICLNCSRVPVVLFFKKTDMVRLVGHFFNSCYMLVLRFKTY